jgi:L-asparaginase II
MVAACKHLGLPTKGYVEVDHPLQRAIANRMGEICDVNLANAPVGTDGCSVPTWAYPLHNMALGFARLADPAFEAGAGIITAVRRHPHLVAGTDRFDTKIMQALPRLFIKVGAEGVCCGCIPHAGLGFALKCDDGAYRGAEVAIANAIAGLDVWTDAERHTIAGFALERQFNWRKREVGSVMAKSMGPGADAAQT